MDRRVFQPRQTSNAERRRSAIGVSLLILIAGGLWLLGHHAPPAPAPAALAVSGHSVKH